MRILSITNDIPYPPLSGAPIRTYNILRRFARDHEVYLAALIDNKDYLNAKAPYLGFCRKIITAKRETRKGARPFIGLLNWAIQRGPAELRLTFSSELAHRIKAISTQLDFDIVQIEHGCMGLYLDAIPFNLHKKTVWTLHDIDFDKLRRISVIEDNPYRKARLWLNYRMMLSWQPMWAQRFGRCITMSEADKALLLNENKDLSIEVSPNGVDTNQYRLLPEDDGSAGVLFIGNMSYQPNIDAAMHFYKNILPIIRQYVDDIEFFIVGKDPAPEIKKLDGNKVFVTGNVADVVPYYKKSKVCVVPLRAGSGTRLKILEAMALGRPVVSTSIGAEGLNLINGKHLLIADKSIEFAKRTTELLLNKELRTRLVNEARKHVVSNYDWDIIAKRLLDVFNILKAG